MTFDELVAIAMRHEDCNDVGGRVQRKGKAMFALKSDGVYAAFKMDWDNRDRLLEERPDIFCITDHYIPWPWLLVDFAKLDENLAEDIVRFSYENALKPAKKRKLGQP